MSKEIGRKLKQLRKEKGLTQEEAAKRLKITRSTISNYEVGRPLTGYASSKKDNPNNIDFNYYRCTGNRVLGCELKSVRAYKIEDYIFNKIKAYVFNVNLYILVLT